LYCSVKMSSCGALPVQTETPPQEEKMDTSLQKENKKLRVSLSFIECCISCSCCCRLGFVCLVSISKKCFCFQGEIKQMEMKIKTMQVELNKSFQMKDKLEALCRELQKQNKFIKVTTNMANMTKMKLLKGRRNSDTLICFV